MARSPLDRKRSKKQSDPQEPDLVAIMNLFLTIIPFLLMMIVTTQMAMVALNFSPSGGGGSDGGGGGGGKNQDLKIVIYASEGVKMFPGFEITDPGGTNVTLRNSENRGAYNYMALNNALGNIKTRNKDNGNITIVVYPNVLYGTLIQTIDLCKKNGFPNVVYKPATTYYGSGG